MIAEELCMSQNVRRHLLMLDCCEICYTVTEEWDICRMHKVSVLACRPCQRKLKHVLHAVIFEAYYPAGADNQKQRAVKTALRFTLKDIDHPYPS